MASDNSRNPPPGLAVGSVVRFGLKYSEYSYQGTVTFFKPENTRFTINNVTRMRRTRSDIWNPEDVYFVKLREIKDFQVIQAAEQNLRNPTNAQNVQNSNVGVASSSSHGQIESSRNNNQDSANTQDVQNSNVGASSSSSHGQIGSSRNRNRSRDSTNTQDGDEASKKARYDR